MGNNGKSQYRSRDPRYAEAGPTGFSEPIVDVDTVLAQDRNTSAVEEAVVEKVRSIEPQQVHANNKTTGELVDNLLIKVFGDSDKVRSALKEGEEHVFTHLQNYGMSEAILRLRLKPEKEHPEFRDELERLESDAQEKLKSLDQSPEFSRDKLRDLLIEYRKNLASLLENNNNNMDKKETSPVVEQKVAPEAVLESPVKLAAKKAEQIDQAAEEVAAVVPQVKPEIKKLVDDSQNGIKEILSASGSSPLGYAENELDKITKPKTKVELNSEKVESSSKIENIKHLIKKLNDAFVAPDTDGYTARRKALQEADDVLGTTEYQRVVLSHDKDKKLVMNDAIERAIKELEDVLRNEELRKNVDQNFVLMPDQEAGLIKTQSLGENLPATSKVVGLEEAEFEVLPNDDKIPKGPEGPKPETDPSLSQKRADFWTELHKRGNVWSKGRFLGITKQNQGKLDDFEKIRAEYSDAQAKELEAKLKSFVAGLDPKLSVEDKNFEFTQEYTRLKKAEDEEIDTIAKGLGIRGMDKFKSWWRRTGLKRGAFGAGLWALGAVTGGMGFLAAKVGLSSVGSYMTAESFLDRHTELGQKGLIDQLKNTGFKRGEKAKITEKDKDEMIKQLMADKYSVKDLEQEWARLRVLSLDKNKGIKEAGRFDAEQVLLVEAVQEVYYHKKAQELAAEMAAGENPEVAKAVSLASFLNSEKNATEMATSEQDKSRKHAIARHGLAALVGVSVGLFASERVLDAIDPAPAEVPLPVEEIPILETPDGLISQGDTVWFMVASHLAKVVPDWDTLNEAQQTRYIDFFENQIVDDPKSFGLTDPDHLQAGTKIHWGGLFADKNLDEGMKFVKTLTQDQMANIEANNDILQEAAKNGVEITSKNVDEVISGIKANGLEQYLAEHGHATAQAVAENAQDIATGVEAESAADIAGGTEAGELADTATEAAGETVDSPAVESLEQSVSDGKVEGFLTGARAYTGDIYESIQSYAETDPEHAHEQMSALINKVFESSPQVQQDFLHDLSPEDFTPDNNKAEVFLKLLQEQKVRLPDINSLDQLQKSIDAFDNLANSTALPGKEFVPRILKIDDANESVYVFAKKVGGKVFGLFGEPKYLIDYSGKTLSVTEKVMLGFLNPRA